MSNLSLPKNKIDLIYQMFVLFIKSEKYDFDQIIKEALNLISDKDNDYNIKYCFYDQINFKKNVYIAGVFTNFKSFMKNNYSYIEFYYPDFCDLIKKIVEKNN